MFSSTYEVFWRQKYLLLQSLTPKIFNFKWRKVREILNLQSIAPGHWEHWGQETGAVTWCVGPGSPSPGTWTRSTCVRCRSRRRTTPSPAWSSTRRPGTGRSCSPLTSTWTRFWCCPCPRMRDGVLEHFTPGSSCGIRMEGESRSWFFLTMSGYSSSSSSPVSSNIMSQECEQEMGSINKSCFVSERSVCRGRNQVGISFLVTVSYFKR